MPDTSLAARMVLAEVRRQISTPAFERRIFGLLMQNPRYRFLRAMARRFIEVDPTMTAKAAFHLACDTLREFLAEEKIGFGDKRYVWDEDAARVVANEMQIEHWETVDA